MKKFNLNDRIHVKIKEKGYQFWYEKYKEILKNVTSFTWSLEELRKKADSNGYVEFQAWDFIDIFGEIINMGSYGYFDMTILIDDEALK